MPKGPKPRPLNDRFWALVDRRGPDECWPWLGGLTQKGYGGFGTLGPDWVGTKKWGAHRLAYHLAVGPIPEGMDIDHLCHDHRCALEDDDDCPHRRCCNPAHLRVATRAENVYRGNNKNIARRSATHCVNGHEFTVATTRIKPNGTRSCKTCDPIQQRQRYALNKAKRATCPVHDPEIGEPC